MQLRTPHNALLGGVLVVALLAGLAPLLGSVWVYWLFQAVCHQNFERALWIAGVPMAVCARCFGIYTGAVVALAARSPARRRALVGAVLLLAADVASEWLGARPPWAAVRLATGLLAGAAAAPLIAEAIGQAMLLQKRPRTGTAMAGISQTNAA